MADMARRTTIVIPPELESALRAASRKEHVSQSELVRRGIELVTAPYRRGPRPSVGWLRLSPGDIEAILREDFGDLDG